MRHRIPDHTQDVHPPIDLGRAAELTLGDYAERGTVYYWDESGSFSAEPFPGSIQPTAARQR